ncbi:CDC27 family protein [uncultured Shewanella sp.]|uniref:CDC27 family protein n=1 Tax=uncultured Shewanella sp. TaxID=173975 RepID=UPI00260EAE99|nr:CDC27 family protein [uncultured Shewanella sp.]
MIPVLQRTQAGDVSKQYRHSERDKPAKTKFLSLLCLMTFAIGFSNSVSATEVSTVTTANTEVTTQANQVLRNKLYRQALYYYFEGDYQAALRQVSINRQRFDADTAKSQLFEAGLQVSVGLHQKATRTLSSFEQTLAIEQALTGNKNQANQTSSQSQKNTSPAELKLVALLQLSEQQIEQGQPYQAQQTLQRITQVPNSYIEQYHILNQLAYWPNEPAIMAKIAGGVNASASINHDNPTDNQSASSSLSAYVMLNQALHFIEQKQYQQAETLLITIKNMPLAETETGFWQSLFTEKTPSELTAPMTAENIENSQKSVTAQESDQQVQQQAINDYAQLLLAQSYVKQGQYQAAFTQLKDFPQQSPYTESALFLYAFSAQQLQQYPISLALLDLLKRQYPYSLMGWQSAILLAAQVREQQSLEQSLTSYQEAETLYLEQLAQLDAFEAALETRFNTSQIMQTALTPQGLSPETLEKHPWLEKALTDNALKNDFTTLASLSLLEQNLTQQQRKSDWLAETIDLNKQRREKRLAQQQLSDYENLISQLTKRKQQLSKQIQAVDVPVDEITFQQMQLFANSTEQAWLQRIESSKQALTNIASARDTEDDFLRLARVEGALNWQLQQSFIPRLWQHKKLLKDIDTQLQALNAQYVRFKSVTQSQQGATEYAIRQQNLAKQIEDITRDIKQASDKTQLTIQQKLRLFTQNQRQQLTQLLLTSRHEMAAVLERMSQQDITPSKAITSDNLNTTKLMPRQEHSPLSSLTAHFEQVEKHYAAH